MDILEQLQRGIIDYRILPGTRLSQLEIAEQFGAAATDVRQALDRLVLEDLARHYPGRGVFVSEISIPDAIELLQVVEALESAAARLAAEGVRLGKPVTRLEAFNAEIKDLSVQPSAAHEERNREVPGQLRGELVAVAGNYALEMAWVDIWRRNERVERMLGNDRTRVAARAHSLSKVVDKVLDGDPEGARSEMSRHVQRDVKTLLDIATGSVAQGEGA